ncbi:hypothetical protein TREVI0001_0315 [Treponema vincentii ATCC 35580]|uniref:Uncharacterized protein n=1 Tax=Treponema vincentii ATCC 35580 TaxID=596324 RepID=C8PQ11_9SPIR|nr:hypothetical protein TREVI0001_0315 [Treponema vincentii ATCC 35580]
MAARAVKRLLIAQRLLSLSIKTLSIPHLLKIDGASALSESKL